MKKKGKVKSEKDKVLENELMELIEQIQVFLEKCGTRPGMQQRRKMARELILEIIMFDGKNLNDCIRILYQARNDFVTGLNKFSEEEGEEIQYYIKDPQLDQINSN